MVTPAESEAPASTQSDPAEIRRAANETATALLREDYAHELNVSFGAHPRQIFDCYLPNIAPVGPVMVFLHGGGFRLGTPGAVAHYGRPILERGGIFVSLGYRLAPEVRFPDTVGDVELGLARLASYVLEKGGDTDRVHLSGHSAGATLAAFAALRPSTKETEALQGLVLVSGMYDFSVQSDEVGNHLSRRYVPDLTQAIEHVPAHVIVVIGDRDLPAVPPAATAMLNALHAKGTPVDSFVEKNADHFEAIRGFASSSSAVASSVASMMGI